MLSRGRRGTSDKSGAIHGANVLRRIAPSVHNGLMEADIDRIVISAEAIGRRVEELAGEIAEAYRPRQEQGVVFVAVLSGAVVFLADLIRKMPFRMKIGLITLSSYAGKRTSPEGPRVIEPLRADVRGKHVLVIDDILDTGGTLRRVRQEVLSHGPASVRTCVLLRKPAKAPPDLTPDFVGFDIRDEFVVGYGLDYDDQYRNYPAIATLRRDLHA